MTYYKNCPGCGEEKQSKSEDKKGFSPKENSLLCLRCFRMVNYGEKSNNLEEYDIEKYLNQIKETNNEVVMVVDCLNPYETLIPEINTYIKKDKLTLVINKTDVLPKSITQTSIIDWIIDITNSKNIEFKNIVIASAKKNLNIDSLFEYMNNSNNNFSFIGYSNVGKSSLIKSIFKSRLKDVKNTISNTIGTTTKIIEVELEKFKIFDYPGFLLKGNYQNILDIKDIEKVMPKKEIKVRNFQTFPKSMYSINDLIFLGIDNDKNDVQFHFSNEIDINRVNYEKTINLTSKEFKVFEIRTNKKSDLIISGFGFITIGKNFKGKLILSKGINFNIINSIYN